MSNRKFSKMNTISSDLITEISNRLSNGSRVDYILPLGGRIHIDRPLPFLCVYRYSSDRSDKGTERLIKAEASYLIVSGSKHFAPGISALIQNISKILSEKFNSFLIVEIWSALHIEKKTDIQESFIKPHFLISVSKARPPTTTVETLRRSLKRIKIHKQSADVDMVLDKILMPKGFSSLIPSKEAKKQRCFILGLEIKPIYRDPVTGEVFPIVLRNLHRGLARSLRRAFFEFSATQTNYQPTHHKALGPRAIIKAVWEVDTQLAEISKSFDFILQATPVNAESAWADFKRCNSMIQDNQAGGGANAVYLLESVPVVSDYSDMQLVNYGKDNRILIQKCNKNTGRWQSGYRFFRRSCGMALPLEKGDILFISFIP